MPFHHNPLLVAVSLLIAVFASYVTLDLAHRVRLREAGAAQVWALAAAVVMGSGIWATHFVGMLAMSLPIPVGYDSGTTAASWAAAVVASLVGLHTATREHLDAPSLAMGALVMGSAISGMHYLGMGAMAITPPLRWNHALVGASVMIACLASAGALRIFFWMRHLSGLRLRYGQAGAALAMGAAIAGMHYTGMAAASFPVDAVCTASGDLGGHQLGVLVVGAVSALMLIALFTSTLDTRLNARALSLTESLQDTNRRLMEANAKLRQLAFEDPLTSLANRALFDDRLRHAKDRMARRTLELADEGRRAGLAVALVNLDGFKPVNDSYGHDAGDLVLVETARRLSGLSRATDTLARLGGDEFVLLLEDLDDFAQSVAISHRILEALRQPHLVNGRELTLTCSIGIAAFCPDNPPGRLLADASAALGNAKRQGGNRCVVFEGRMNVDVGDQLELQEDLRHAATRGQLCLHYQPKVSCLTHAVRGMEALLRWDHPTRGRIPPDQFIPIAERYGIINELGDWVLHEACRQLAQWTRVGLRLNVAINLSAHQLRQPDIVDKIRAAVALHGVNPAQLVCEVTESAAMDDVAATQQIQAQLAALGVSLSIDDFGTGYSSLSSLRLLKPQELKIDRSFVRDLTVSMDARAVVDAVIRLAKALGLRVVAEGVETWAQSEALTALGCDEMQGYYFARPMEPERLEIGHFHTADGGRQIRFSDSAFMGGLPA